MSYRLWPNIISGQTSKHPPTFEELFEDTKGMIRSHKSKEKGQRIKQKITEICLSENDTNF
jgi:hypothetical protein